MKQLFSIRFIRNTGLVIIILFIILLSSASFLILNKINSNFNFVVNEQVPSLDLMIRVHSEFSQIYPHFQKFLDYQTDEYPLIIKHIDNSITNMLSIIQLASPEEKTHLEKSVTSFKQLKFALKANRKMVLEDPASSNVQELETIATEKMNEINSILSDVSGMIQNRINSTEEKVKSNIEFHKKGIILFLPISIIIGVCIIIIFNRALAMPINKLIEATNRLAGGDMNFELDIEGKDEFSKLVKSFNSMAKKLVKNRTAELTEINENLLTEINERKNVEDKLQHMAYYDQLTGLPNRANFLAYAKRMLKRSKFRSDYLYAVLFLDLDRFKLINDSLGHSIGDQLLAEVACRMDECLRATDKISRVAGSDSVARFGGDEFAIFLNDVKDLASASRVAERMQIALQKPFNINGHELYTSASIGIALSTSEYESAEDILRDADSAMYRAKSLGKACSVIYDEEMHRKVSQMLQLESELRTAVKKDQFMVYYQPIVSVKDGRIVAAEALLRWNHPKNGFISPMDFIPIAEEIGLISNMGEWILREACRQNKEWQDAGYQPILMKVNFSSRQFKDHNLAKLVKRVIEETGMPFQFLDVEITESIAMEKSSIKILNQLTDIGVKTSIDDFGTGYSSLGALRKFPINTIKIDRSFINDISDDINAKAIINAIIAMAHSLKMEVVAEGVETEEQLAFLQSEKCEMIQGYLYSPPVPEEEFRKLLEEEKNGYPLIQKHSESMA